jgi:predicted metal-dependent phosphoesterase TrpH
MDALVDLHVHTNYSDGVFTPERAVQYAREKGLAAISITDHDIVDGIPAAIAEGQRQGVEVIPGIELSAEVISAGQSTEMHILGYYINWENRQFLESLTLFRTYRQERARKIFDKLHNLGVALDTTTVYPAGPAGAIGRLHIAKALIAQGFAANVVDAFQKYLGIGKPAYVPKLRLTPQDAISMILKVGGIPVLAHPYYGHYSNRNLLRALVKDGLRGIEVWHSKHAPQTVALFTNLAAELGLIATGGSDCHGGFGNEHPLMGTIKVPYSAVEQLKQCRDALAAATAEIFPNNPENENA